MKPFIVHKITVKGRQGHWRWHNSIGRISLSSNHVPYIVSEVFNVE